MITENYVEIQGSIVDAGELQIVKAQELATAVSSGAINWTRLLECRRLEAKDQEAAVEMVIFDVEVEVPQRKLNDVRRSERIAVALCSEDSHFPEVLALRSDFPPVPHLNLRACELPRSLCIYDEPYSEVRLRWTAPRFIERIRTWLADTATGTLHREDQHLEPFLMGAIAPIVLPSNLLTRGLAQIPERLNIFRVNGGSTKFCLVAERLREGTPDQTNAQAQKFNATIVVGAPQKHGIIQQQPRNLSQLHKFLQNANIDLCGILRERLRDWRDYPQLLNAGLVLVLVLPKTRVEGGPVETPDIWALLCTRILPESGEPEAANAATSSCPTATEIGEQLGLWTIKERTLALLIPIDEHKQGSRVEVALLNPCFSLSRNSAARFNGVVNPDALEIVAIGMGALGSQLTANLIRTGYGDWTLIDRDLLLPHNPARHELPGFAVGTAKAETMAGFANTTIDGQPIATPIVADILNPGESDQSIRDRFAEAEVILDLSASVAVGRHLDRSIESPARRVSLFLNPNGTDLVLLAEDSARHVPLTALEMQYYRFLTTEAKMAHHLDRSEGQLRYARSCRDLSAVIPQDLVALHASIGSRAFRVALESESPRITIWQAKTDGSVARFEIEVAPIFWERRGDWLIHFDKQLIQQVQRFRKNRLPSETGGVLIGSFDLLAKIVYVVDAMPAPEDSTEEPEGFVRGKHGLTGAVERIEKITAGQLMYVGEWHSHPVGHGVKPSDNYDRKLFQWLSNQMMKDGLPPLMLIIGDRNQRGWYLGNLPEFN